MATLSTLNNNQYAAYQVDGISFLSATVFHPNTCWTSSLEVAPGLLPDPAGGAGSAPILNFYSEPPASGAICLQVTQKAIKTQRFDPQGKSAVYVQDGYGYQLVQILPVL